MRCPSCNEEHGHTWGCEQGGPAVTKGDPPLSKEERAEFAEWLRVKLDSRRNVFALSRSVFDFMLPDDNSDAAIVGESPPDNAVKKVSAASLRLLLDYCENLDWPIGLVEYCAGVFHSREAAPGETPFDLLPDEQEGISADRLGFGHIYGGR